MIRAQRLHPGSGFLHRQWCSHTPGSWSLQAHHNHKAAFTQLRSPQSKGKPAQLAITTLNNEGQTHRFPGLSKWPRQDITGSFEFWVLNWTTSRSHSSLCLSSLKSVSLISRIPSLFNIYSGLCFPGWTLGDIGILESKLSRLNSYPMLLTCLPWEELGAEDAGGIWMAAVVHPGSAQRVQPPAT